MNLRAAIVPLVLSILGACSGADKVAQKSDSTSDPHAEYGPLDVGADYASYTKVTKEPFESDDHGGRFVEIYVNDVGLSAYQNETDFPVGSIVVKTSWERSGDKPSSVAGPVFVMEKRAAGFDPDHSDWFYGFHWENVPKKSRKFGKQLYWRSPSRKVDYCWDCHENYDREVGMPPEDKRAW